MKEEINGNTAAILLYGTMQTKEFHRSWVCLQHDTGSFVKADQKAGK